MDYQRKELVLTKLAGSGLFAKLLAKLKGKGKYRDPSRAFRNRQAKAFKARPPMEHRKLKRSLRDAQASQHRTFSKRPYKQGP